MKHFLVTLALLAALLVPARIASAQGLYWETATTGGMFGDKTMHSQCAYMPMKLKQTSAERGIAIIVRLDTKMIYSINNEKKTYWQISLEDFEGMMKKAGSMVDDKMAEMKKRMAEMPPEQRKMVEQMMGSKFGGKNADAPVQVTATGTTRTISGYTCEGQSVKEGDKTLFTIWTTTGIPGFAAMKKELLEFGQRLAAMSPMNGSAMSEGMKKVDGFPIQTEFVSPEFTTTVTKIEKKSTPADAFEVPHGYTKVEPELLGGRK